MNIDELSKLLDGIGIVPVITVDDDRQAIDLADALLAGGLPLMEITFRSDAAASAIRSVARDRPEVTVGAGTVLTTDQVDAALASGAQFIVAPGFNPTVARHCLERAVPFIPGVATPSELELAMEMGFTTLKFFPAEQSGGVPYIKAMSAPYRGVRFMPTGGVTAGNLKDYLALPSVGACGGSWITKIDLIRAGDFATITRLAQEAVALAGSA
jgi:2-dehydro-3-deoxyphosphogluconate aldolase/(4S)-4-hydroxy-2-oxoglutarate aldolase